MRNGCRRLRLAGTALIVAAALGTAGSGPALASGSGPLRPGAGSLGGPFVALGDSFAAGNLIPASPSGTPAGCLRSSHNYGADAAAALRVTGYIDATCSGATTTSMTQPEPVRGGTGPDAFDCSGLVMMAYRAAGIDIARTSQAQWVTEQRVPASQVQPGDLVFFAGSDGTATSPGHVGLVIGNGKMIEAYATGFPIRVSAYGQPSSPVGDQGPIGFTQPWAQAGAATPAASTAPSTAGIPTPGAAISPSSQASG